MSQNKENSEHQSDVLNKSAETGDTAASTSNTLNTSLSFSVTSESSLLVPGKLHSEIVKLKQCYIKIIREIEQVKGAKNKTISSADVLMINKDQIMSCTKKQSYNASLAKAHLVDLLDSVRSVCLPDYQVDNRPQRVQQDVQITELTSRVESLCTQNKTEFDVLKTQLDSLKLGLSKF